MRREDRSKHMMAFSGMLIGAAWTLGVIAAPPALAESSLVIRDFVMTHGVYEREPVGTTDSFNSDDGKAYAFVRINNEGAPTRVSFIWQYGNETHATINQTVGSSAGWRTWSSVNLKPGNWHVQVVSEDGEVLAQRDFSVGDQAVQPASTATSKDTMEQDGSLAPVEQPDANYGGWTGKSDG